MQPKEVSAQLPSETITGSSALSWSLLGIMAVLHAVNHTGLSSLVGWLLVVAANVMVFITSRNSQLQIWPIKDKISIILFVIWLFSIVTVITIMAGLWGLS